MLRVPCYAFVLAVVLILARTCIWLALCRSICLDRGWFGIQTGAMQSTRLLGLLLRALLTMPTVCYRVQVLSTFNTQIEIRESTTMTRP